MWVFDDSLSREICSIQVSTGSVDVVESKADAVGDLGTDTRGW